jgi:hypothetical protein
VAAAAVVLQIQQQAELVEQAAAVEALVQQVRRSLELLTQAAEVVVVMITEYQQLVVLA